MPADSLLETARRACMRLSKRLTDIGDMPYDLIRPVLLKIESPEQLHALETNSPQLIGRDAEIWLNLIKRDIPDWESKPHEPRDPKNWWKVYRKLKQESQHDMAQGADKLKAALDSIKSEKEHNLAQLVTRKELPRTGPTMKQKIVYNYLSGKTGSKGASKLSLMDKIKKEAKDARAARLHAPTAQFRKQASTVTRPPPQFVEELRIQKQQQQQRPCNPSPERPIRVPRTASISEPAGRRTEDLTYRDMKEREARLQALKAGKPLPDKPGVPEVAWNSPTTPRVATDPKVGPAPASKRMGDVELSTAFLENPDRDHRKRLGDALARPGTRSPARIPSPQGRVKRKEAPNIFMPSAKKLKA